MPNFHEGDLAPPPGRFAIVASRFNQLVVDALLTGACDTLRRHGVADANMDVARVPGSLEIPLAAKRLAESGRYVAVICLGAVIRGDTDHYDHVASGAAHGIAQVALATNIPVIFGILTCDTLEQALNRAGAKAGNKGSDAASTAIEMVNLLRQLPGRE
ncbi:MAG: 6,7-dimethyl-8-ribityllumazine synthase [Gemmataceae bacterium]